MLDLRTLSQVATLCNHFVMQILRIGGTLFAEGAVCLRCKHHRSIYIRYCPHVWCQAELVNCHVLSIWNRDAAYLGTRFHAGQSAEVQMLRTGWNMYDPARRLGFVYLMFASTPYPEDTALAHHNTWSSDEDSWTDLDGEVQTHTPIE